MLAAPKIYISIDFSFVIGGEVEESPSHRLRARFAAWRWLWEAEGGKVAGQPRSLTWPLKNGGWKTTFLLGR